jgi:hypothetical protein
MATDWARVLAGIGPMLSAWGQPGGIGNGPMALAQGVSAYDAGKDRAADREFQHWQQEQAKAAADAERLANTKAAEQDRLRQQLLSEIGQGGPMQTASTAPGAGPMQGGQIDPRLFQAFPELGQEYIKRQAFPEQAKDTRTDDQREYEFAKTQGYQGSFLDFILDQKKAGASSTKVDVHAPTSPTIGAIPPGYVAIPDGSGKYVFEKIPGGPAAEEAAIAADKQADIAASAQQTTDIVTEEINRVLEMGANATLPTTGGTGAALSFIPGTAAFNSSKLLDTIKSNIGFDRLQQMRDQSPTGGALGNVTKPEMDLLQAAKGSLAQSQDQKQFEYNLKRLYNLYLDTVHGKGGGPARYDLGQAAPGPSAPQGGDIKSKYGLE